MALPTSRNTTYDIKSQVKSVDLNDIQDKIIDLWAGKHGDVTEWVSAQDANNASAATLGWKIEEASNTFYMIPDKASAKLVITLPLKVGARLKEVHAHCYDNSSDTVSLSVYKQSVANGAAPGASSQLGGSQNTSGTSTNIQLLSVTSLSETVPDSTKYVAVVSTNQASPANTHRFYGLRFVYDRP